MRSDRLYLTDMVDAAQAIAGFIAEMDPAQFYQDGKTQSAVVQKLIVIGELPPGYRAISKPATQPSNGGI